MALFINQTDDRSELQQRLNAELQERAKKRALIEGLPKADEITSSNYLKDTKQTTSLAWVWVLLVIVASLATIGLIIYSQVRANS